MTAAVWFDAPLREPLTVVRPLGEGGMCTVHLVEDAGGRRVAVKVLRPALAADPVERARFADEGRIGASLRHPAVLRVLGVMDWEGLPALVLEYVDGVTFRVLLDRGLEEGAARRILADVVGALQAAHLAGVVHRDLKPENVLVRPDGSAVVGDWGLARRYEDPGGLTRTGTVVGTPAYMAPERVDGAAPTPAVDAYALGVMAFEALTRRHPFPVTGALRLLRAHLTTPPPDPRSLRPAMASPLAVLIQGLMAKKPAQRPRLDDVRRALLEAAPPSPPPAAPSVPRRRLRVAAAVLLGLVAAVWSGYRGSEPRRSGPAIEAVSIIDPGTLEVLVDASAAGQRRFTFVDSRTLTSLAPAPVTTELSTAVPRSRRLSALRLRVSPPLLRPYLLVVEGGAEVERVGVDPVAWLGARLAAVDAQRQDAFEAMLAAIRRLRDDVYAERGRVPWEAYVPARREAQRRFDALLQEAWGPDAVAGLLGLGETLAGCDAGLDGPLALRLERLRRIDGAVAEWDGVRPPWGLPVDLALGVTFQQLELSSLVAGPEGAGVVDLERRVGDGRGWEWLAPPGFSNPMDALLPLSHVVGELLRSRRDLYVEGEVLPAYGAIVQRLERAVPGPSRVGSAMQGRRLILDVYVRLFVKNVELVVSVGERPVRLWVANVSLVVDMPRSFASAGPLRVGLPLEATDLGPGPVRVRLEARLAPGCRGGPNDLLHPVCIHALGLSLR